MRNILVRRGVYPWTTSPEPRKDLGSPTDNSVRTADTIELKRLYVGHICIKRVIEGHLGGHLEGHFYKFSRSALVISAYKNSQHSELLLSILLIFRV